MLSKCYYSYINTSFKVICRHFSCYKTNCQVGLLRVSPFNETMDKSCARPQMKLPFHWLSSFTKLSSSDMCSITGVSFTGLMFLTKLSEAQILAFLTASPSFVFGGSVLGKLEAEMVSANCFGLFSA